MPSLYSNSELIEALRRQYAINWNGHHGVAHWSRVRLNGRELAQGTAADLHVIELFSLFHDACRCNEHLDDDHGVRGFRLAAEWQGRLFEATPRQMTLLEQACRFHSDGAMDGPLTVRMCWDADRLDLLRVGVMPLPQYLCTAQGRRPEQLARSNARAQAWLQAFEERRANAA